MRLPNRVLIPAQDERRSAVGDPHDVFVSQYLADDKRRAAVVAVPGVGKTTVAMRVAGEMIRRQRADFVLVFVGASALRDRLIHLGEQHGLQLSTSTAELALAKPGGICIAAAQLNVNTIGDQLLKLSSHSSLFVLVEEAHRINSRVSGFVSQLVEQHPKSRLLALITPSQRLASELQDHESQWRELIDVEYLFEPYWLHSQSLLLQAVVVARTKIDEGRLVEAVTEPWFEIISAILRDPAIVHQLSPRKWEEMVAGVYVRAGFDEVILTPVSGDHGRDIIATKYGLGTVRVIDQVKAFKPGHLVTANDVRALMGVLHLDGASKGFVTTTSDFAPHLQTDPLIAPLIPSRLELVNGTQLLRRLRELTATRHYRCK